MFTFYHLQRHFKHIILFDAYNFGRQGRYCFSHLTDGKLKLRKSRLVQGHTAESDRCKTRTQRF